MKLQDILLGFVVAFFWGINAIFAKYILDLWPPMMANAARLLLSSLILLPFIRKPPYPFLTLFFTSIFWTLYYSLFSYGLAQGANASSAVIAGEITIPCMSILGYFILKEKLSLITILGNILAFAGIVVSVKSPNIRENILGFSLILGSGFFWAVSSIIVAKVNRKYAEKTDFNLLIWISIIVTPQLAILSLLTNILPPSLQFLNPEAALYANMIDFSNPMIMRWLTTLYISVFTGGIAYVIWFKLISKYPSSQVSIFLAFVPVFGVFAGVFIRGDELFFYQIIGAIMITFGAFLVLYGKLQFKKPSELK